ncbi:MAG: hypothetical protein QF662_05125, partial [Phycisphaerae bacterium]|nr:hypothetical protein [Phycisphaerae bacterium]
MRFGLDTDLGRQVKAGLDEGGLGIRGKQTTAATDVLRPAALDEKCTHASGQTGCRRAAGRPSPDDYHVIRWIVLIQRLKPHSDKEQARTNPSVPELAAGAATFCSFWES